MEESNLPPLKPNSRNNSQERFKEEVSPINVKKRVLKQFMDIQNMDKQIEAIKQQLPLNLNKMLLQIRQETQRLIETETPTISQNDFENYKDLLQNFEEKYMLKADQTISDVTLQIKTTANQSFEKSIEELKNTTDPRLDMKIESLRSLLKQHEKRINNKISYLEHEVSKLGIKPTDSGAVNTISRVKRTLVNNSNDLKIIESKLNDLQRVASKKAQSSTSPIQTNNNITIESLSNFIPKKVVDEPPNLTEPLALLQQVVTEFEKEYSEKLVSLDEKSVSIEESIDELDGMIDDLTAATNEIELHTKETETLCKELTQSISKISSKLNDDSQNLVIQRTALQIQQLSSSTRSDITNLYNKVKKIELSLPL
ncbi:hypothetical protein TVAG_311700 [Trichomonas vaginalis G3]|uniref:Uncharacterized protein n=1 Tax=Trichomonas vaginalis (strain ATCC PRA-98 / G3) TaxID=412133 RepID=A2EJX7_TRIV3|nr:hypothetical protein TVAGG3_0324910 [Trichomonas vaginalis G3]EAY07045.1 hypothetical protein TVAG_311700 [Trichomonas vaginalis G3]KAI5529559.1 hypothetical protein TVAGG3_0324910 [Trichomonas vaginalis G3]|eukprot:XP_001319268.1 hypothetical protein [Trichomonas vaginalis G3]